METSDFLRVTNLSMTFPNGNGGLNVLDQISFGVAPQEFMCVLGPSGSGKTTLLRLLAGLLRPTHGKIEFSTPNVRIGYVFQQANLMPWRTALQNITLPLELQGVPLQQARSQAQAWVEKMGLQGFEGARPRDLSGGMAQRVALARALISEPDVLLLDEPFGALDALTRERLGDELLLLWQAQRKTVILVTHSISEALLLADRVLVFSPRPAQIILDLPVPLPRPRTTDIRYTAEFGVLARQLRSAIGFVK